MGSDEHMESCIPPCDEERPWYASSNSFFRAAFADKLYSHCWMASNGPASSNINTFWLDWLLDSLASKIPVSGIKS